MTIFYQYEKVIEFINLRNSDIFAILLPTWDIIFEDVFFKSILQQT